MIEVGDYIEGYEIFGGSPRIVNGWVLSIGEGLTTRYFYVSVDDDYNGKRHTVLLEKSGDVSKCRQQKKLV